jgi:hypothetical protein
MGKVVTIEVLRPEAFSGKGSVIFIELLSDQQTLEVAKNIAAETGRCVVVRDENMNVIETIRAPTIQ